MCANNILEQPFRLRGSTRSKLNIYGRLNSSIDTSITDEFYDYTEALYAI